MESERYMDERDVQNILIEILYAIVNELENYDSIKQKITPDILVSIYRLAKKHDLAHVVSDFVYRAKLEVDDELQSRLQREEYLVVYRHEHIKYAFGEICNVFEEAGITYIPLKGSVLRPYYPYERMRTSCDIDILIHEDDLETAISLLENKGYRCKERNYHDVSLYSQNKIHLELHFNIQENADKLDEVLKDAWNYAVPLNGSRYAFSKEFFAFHIFAHMAYHFISGGCGIRSLLDIWVMEHKMGITYLCAKNLLEKAGIYQFALEISNLADQCFSRNNNRDSFSESVLNYIFQGGIYGSASNRIAVNKAKTKSSIVYTIKRLFLPYKSMIVIYPFLKKAPYLLPFCWVTRCLKVVFGGKSKRIISEISCVKNIPNEKIKEIQAICSRLEL